MNTRSIGCALSIHQKECRKSLGCALYIGARYLPENTVICASTCLVSVFPQWRTVNIVTQFNVYVAQSKQKNTDYGLNSCGVILDRDNQSSPCSVDSKCSFHNGKTVQMWNWGSLS
jgi:hypothetical protein